MKWLTRNLRYPLAADFVIASERGANEEHG